MARPSDRLPLTSFLKVDKELEREMIKVLSRTGAAVEKDIRELNLKTSFSASVQRDQKRQLLVAIRQREAELWDSIGHTVSAAKARAAASAANVMSDYTDALTRTTLSTAEQARMRELAVAQAQRQVDSAIARELHSKITLSQQVYKTRQLASGQIDRHITSALGRGLNARDLAREMRQFIDPSVRGGVSYAANRLARTEINNAFHATQIAYAKDSPFVTGMQWHLSGSHKRPDECNDYASHDPYTPAEVPAKPHPQCLCYVTPETPSNDDFIRKYMAGDYDRWLDSVL